MIFSDHFLIFFFSDIILLVQVGKVTSCPTYVDTTYTRDCDGLTSIPTDIPAGATEIIIKSQSTLQEVAAGAFGGLTAVESIEISSSYSLHTIHPGAFPSSLSTLQYLHVKHNRVRSLGPGILDHLTNLRELHAEFNRIIHIPSGIFSNLTKLTYLNIIQNHMTTVESGAFMGLNSIIDINIGGNRLPVIHPGTFPGLVTLQKLELGGGYVTSLGPGIFNDLTDLRTLSVHYHRIATLEAGVFSNLRNLTRLDLAFNQLTTLSPGLFQGLTLLKELYLQENQLTQTILPRTFENLTSLMVLKLGANQIAHLEPDMFIGVGLDELTHLELYNNPFSVVEPNTFTGLSKLTHLFLNNGGLEEIKPLGLSGLPKLQYIKLDEIKIDTLPFSIFNPLDYPDGHPPRLGIRMRFITMDCNTALCWMNIGQNERWFYFSDYEFSCTSGVTWDTYRVASCPDGKYLRMF